MTYRPARSESRGAPVRRGGSPRKQIVEPLRCRKGAQGWSRQAIPSPWCRQDRRTPRGRSAPLARADRVSATPTSSVPAEARTQRVGSHGSGSRASQFFPSSKGRGRWSRSAVALASATVETACSSCAGTQGRTVIPQPREDSGQVWPGGSPCWKTLQSHFINSGVKGDKRASSASRFRCGTL